MIRHIVMWKFRPDTQREQAQFLDGLRGLQGLIPELLTSVVAKSVGEDSYDAVLVADFVDLPALERYKSHPRHQAVSALCKDIRTKRAALDYEL